jgi:hypothetical protein
MKTTANFTLENLMALEPLSTEEGRDAYSVVCCSETLLPSPNHLPERMVPENEAKTISRFKAEGLDKKVGGLFSVYVNSNKAYEANLMDLYCSAARIFNLSQKPDFDTEGIAIDQASGALDFLLMRYIGSKLKNVSEFAYYLHPNTKFELEAEVLPLKAFGQAYAKFENFNLKTCGDQSIEIPEKYENICAALMLYSYMYDIVSLESKEEMAKPTLSKEEAKIEDFIKKTTAKYCQKA